MRHYGVEKPYGSSRHQGARRVPYPTDGNAAGHSEGLGVRQSVGLGTLVIVCPPREDVRVPEQTMSPISRRDPLKNGGLTAVLFAVYLCETVGEEGDPPYWRGTLPSVR